METAYSIVPYGGRIRDFVQVEQANTFAADLLAEVKLQLRVQQSVEDLLISRYINASLRAVENVLHKDVFPRTVTCRWMGGGKLFISAGEIRNLSLHSGTSPDEVDMLGLVKMWGDTSFRGGGLFLGYNNAYAPVLEASDADLFLEFETGFVTTAALPDEIVFFVLQMCGFAYLNREIGGTGTIAFSHEVVPKYMLEPLMRMVVA